MQIYTVTFDFTLGAGDEVVMKDLIDEVLCNAADQLKEQHVITHFETSCDSYDVASLGAEELLPPRQQQPEDPHG